MWSIEVSFEASEEEIDKALLEELDFDYIRDQIAKLKMVVEKYGPLKEVQEKTENTSTDDFTRTYDDKRGWICDELESIDSRKVWTLIVDQWNGRSYMSSGYMQTVGGAAHVASWFVADKPLQEEDSNVNPSTEYIISVIYEEDEDDQGYFALDLWSLIDTNEVSDQAIMGALAN